MNLLFLSAFFALLPQVVSSRKALLILELLIGLPILLLNWYEFEAIGSISYLLPKLPQGALLLFASLFHVGVLVRFVGVYYEGKISRLEAFMLELIGILMILVVYISYAFGRYYQEIGYIR
ncbi:hypothetical protein [Pseudovibrio sp. Tun.PSC04-5.I4]|uniref:hypothetical protein n=1 Tax=Pseudovibrio sp. Tun.PSC04-5.I4 TaxID=1798213 RepID=UPI00087E3E1D|nr:hypothetical protein [Pseudovibrio sp. Tun.PSC04-5.I4]SDR31787.1 hypothetical protein SAMN04515695_4430 [Pseudovibrio sp. Tun.PSC04-5.I4]